MLLFYASACLALAALSVLVLHIGTRQFVRLRDVSVPPDDWSPPFLSVIVAARNEERDIEQAIQSLLDLEYEPLQLTIVDDRSTDRTGEILDRLAERFPRLNIVHLDELPAGWLGKNHALQLGAERSDGEWLLFTDADIVFEPTSLSRAVWWAEQHGVDHLAAAPDIRVDGYMLNAFVATFVVFFNAYFQPWRARDPKSRAFIGIGAFNLVKASAYAAVEGHRRLKMRPDDDVKLGKVLKVAGFRQDILIGADMISVRWYASIAELIGGLEKNAFAGVEYNPITVVGSSLMILAGCVGPFLGAVAASGWPQVLFAIAAILWLYCCWHSCWSLKQSPWHCFGFPLAVVLFAYIQWRTMLLNYWLGGIRWRDTHYSLKELRENRV